MAKLIFLRQAQALREMKAAYPSGSSWITGDGREIKVAPQQSVKEILDGDDDRGDGQLKREL